MEKFAPIIVLVIATIVVKLLNIQTELVGDIATIPNSLPGFMLPDFSLIPQLALGASSVVVGLIGILAGLLVLGRFLVQNLVHETVVVVLLGSVIVLTGLIHGFEGFWVRADHQRQRSWLSALMGILELLLSVAVLVWRQNFGSVFYGVVTARAFLGAVVLLREALSRQGWHNYALFMRGAGLLFGYFETPESFEAARVGMDGEPINGRWQDLIAPFFGSADGEHSDKMMVELEEIFHLDRY